ncbi:DUF2986 domain-containing protein [Aliivibrio fischeri]|uniref:DUF2986 domain-containing protein n=1 Tax=Aliivibrio fischeri SR5 TaxID=1088719 RepID=A0AAV3EQ03_ALIFS|nr:DUF2986 domain-containing protein [Aliivibrio fischeri]EHN69002.1 hypothetical protein VFSR5_A0301 [Aliivibrio fischeri SR5]MUL08632.1 DUF2986 domain-containing protein [Aliivibrio fischeri]MUL13370.1 DUF2986 domain-containing protein [Aliivibrio fischeri]OED58009.1 DUF2986 domain-containing protein [Aliivibrio fischeri]
MSRKKKVKDAILKKHRKNQTKQSRANKPKYISKADREKMELEEDQTSDNVTDSATSEE